LSVLARCRAVEQLRGRQLAARDAVEAAFFASASPATSRRAIVNRVHPSFGEGRPGPRARVETLAARRRAARAAGGGAASADRLETLCQPGRPAGDRRRRHHLAGEARAGRAAVPRPFLCDVYDFGALAEVGRYLFAASARVLPGG
jgi:hypothetical protein